MTTPEIRSAAPLRTCVGCRQRWPQSRLVRCVAGPQGVSVSRTAAGRGAWLCSAACFHTAERRRSFDRAWKRTVDPNLLRTLELDVQNAFDDVNTKMEELPAVGVPTDPPAATKG